MLGVMRNKKQLHVLATLDEREAEVDVLMRSADARGVQVGEGRSFFATVPRRLRCGALECGVFVLAEAGFAAVHIIPPGIAAHMSALMDPRGCGSASLGAPVRLMADTVTVRMRSGDYAYGSAYYHCDNGWVPETGEHVLALVQEYESRKTRKGTDMLPVALQHMRIQRSLADSIVSLFERRPYSPVNVSDADMENMVASLLC